MNVIEVGGPELSGVEEEVTSEGSSNGAGKQGIVADAMADSPEAAANPYDVSVSEEKTSFDEEQEEEPVLNKKPSNASGRQGGIKLARSDSFDYSQQERELNVLRDQLENERDEKNKLETENKLLQGQVDFLKKRLMTMNSAPGMLSPGSDFTQNSLQLSGRIATARVPSPNKKAQDGSQACNIKRPRTSSYAKQQQQKRQDIKLNVPMDRVYEKQIKSILADKTTLENELEELKLRLEDERVQHAKEIKRYQEDLNYERKMTKTSRAATRAAQRELAEKNKEKVQKAQELDDYPALLSASVLRKIAPILNHYINAVRERRAAPTVNTLVEGDLILELLELARTGVVTVSTAAYGEKQVITTYTESALDRLIRDMKKKITVRNYEKIESEPLAESSMRLSSQIRQSDKSSLDGVARTPGNAHGAGKSSRMNSNGYSQSRPYGGQNTTVKSSKSTYGIDGRPVASGGATTSYPKGITSPKSPVSEAKENLARSSEERRKAVLAEKDNVRNRKRIWGIKDDDDTASVSAHKKSTSTKKYDSQGNASYVPVSSNSKSMNTSQAAQNASDGENASPSPAAENTTADNNAPQEVQGETQNDATQDTPAEN